VSATGYSEYIGGKRLHRHSPAMNTTATRLEGNHVVLSWSHAQGHTVQLYREVGASGPADKGAVIATRELPNTATVDEVKLAEAELTAMLYGATA
jgi:hypothetical protein